MINSNNFFKDRGKSLKSKKFLSVILLFNNNLWSVFDITKKSAFIFGVEKTGVSKEVIKNADGILKIPMAGFTESLNISVAAAIILENLTYKLRTSSINWNLTHKEEEELYTQWIEKTIKNVGKIKEHFLKDE